MSVEDIDKVMSYGLGHRYAFLGAMETALLNAEGISYSSVTIYEGGICRGLLLLAH